MNDRESKAVGDGTGADAPPKRVRVNLASDGDVDLQYATDVIVNFTGHEFLVSFLQIVPPTFRSPEEIPDEIQGRTVCRIAVAPGRWAAAVDSFTLQLERLRQEGTVPQPEEEAEEEE